MLNTSEVESVRQILAHVEIMEQLAVCLLVFGAKIFEVSIQSMKTVCMVRGERMIAAVLGFLECMIWGLVISSIIDSLGDNYLLLLFYCMGYAAGMYVGSLFEGKVALGTSSVQMIVPKEYVEALEEYMHEHKHGYTVLSGHGAKEEMCVVIMILPRKEVKGIIGEVRALCQNKVFIVSSDVSKFVGGYGIRK